MDYSYTIHVSDEIKVINKMYRYESALRSPQSFIDSFLPILRFLFFISIK